MRSYLILIPIFLLSLIQGAVLPLNLILLLVLVWTVVRPPKESLIVAFFSGIFLDLAKGTPLGISSFVLLVTSYLLLLYSRRFDAAHPIFFSLFVFFASTIFNLIFKTPWLIEGIILALLSLLTRPITRFYQEELDRGKLKLKI